MNGGTTNETLEQHLLFHKALIDDNVASEKIDRYLSILNEAPDCERMQDPIDESIRTVFRLVLEQDFDPWSIDLREFVKTYTAKVNSSNKLDIIVAGKLILMAWKVLRMQTDAAKLESDRPTESFEFEDFEDIEADYEPTLYVPGISLRETYARTPQRPVTMIELLDAFEEAREEIIASVERERVRQELRAKEPKTFDNKAHKEVSEAAHPEDRYGSILHHRAVRAQHRRQHHRLPFSTAAGQGRKADHLAERAPLWGHHGRDQGRLDVRKARGRRRGREGTRGGGLI